MDFADEPPLSILAGKSALLLDFDGTLVELAETPDTIAVPGALPDLLARLAARQEGRLAIVSGRALADLDRHLPLAGLARVGSHGLELRLADGSELPVVVPPAMGAARRAIVAFAATKEGLLIEQKPAGIALHYRRAPELAIEVLDFLETLAAETGLSLQRGKMVGELRAFGADKGDALRALMREPNFAGARPWFMGDDLTDEDGFAAAAQLGGGGLLVGSARASAARWRLPDVAAAWRWLEAVAAMAAGHG